MKLLSPILLGLGLLGAATASDSTNNLRANISARQLSSSGSDSESWIYFLFLNGLNAVGDIRGGPDSCCCNNSLDRCQHPHLPCPPLAKKHCSSGSGGSGGSGGGGSGCSSGSCATSDGSSASSSSSNYNNNDDGSNSNYDKSANDDGYSGENDDGNNQANYYNNNDDGANGGNNQGNDDGSGSGEDQYLYNEYNEGSGYVNQITGGKSISVWPIIIAAIAIGAVAAALVATKKVSFTFANIKSL
jgi:hypothetical protein